MYRFDVSNAQLLKYEEGVKEQARYEKVAAGGKKKRKKHADRHVHKFVVNFLLNI